MQKSPFPKIQKHVQRQSSRAKRISITGLSTVSEFPEPSLGCSSAFAHLAEGDIHLTWQSLAPSWLLACLPREATERRRHHSYGQLLQPPQPPSSRGWNQKQQQNLNSATNQKLNVLCHYELLAHHVRSVLWVKAKPEAAEKTKWKKRARKKIAGLKWPGKRQNIVDALVKQRIGWQCWTPSCKYLHLVNITFWLDIRQGLKVEIWFIRHSKHEQRGFSYPSTMHWEDHKVKVRL